MRRILVPLDGSQLAEAILPDAWRYAGPGGELLLARDSSWIPFDHHRETYTEWQTIEETDRYLESLVKGLEETGVRASAYRLGTPDIARAIDDAATSLKVDMVAVATHGRGPLGRLFLGSVAWKALANSRVPVLLRHPEKEWAKEPGAEAAQREIQVPPGAMLAVQCMMRASEAVARRIIVPLDGSPLAEAAIPLAGELAAEWRAPIYFAQVLTDAVAHATPPHRSRASPSMRAQETAGGQAYLRAVSERLAGEVHTEMLIGPLVTAALVHAVDDWGITDVVMTSHGRTGLRQAIAGSVADGLIQRLHCPIVVIPALAADSLATL